MRKIILIMSVLLVSACISEVKPILKPVEVDIPNRIADQQKWLDQDIAAKAITQDDARPIRDKLNKINERYNRLQSAGTLTPEDSKTISRMLDETSDMIFRLKQRRKKTTTY